MELKRVIDDGIFREEEYTQTAAEMVIDLQNHFANPFTAVEWIGSIAEEIAVALLPYLIEGAEELPMPGNEHLRDDAPELSRDLIIAWRNCFILADSACRDGHLRFSFSDLTHAYYLGCAIQRWKVRPKAPMVKKYQRQVGMLAKARQSRREESRNLEKECRDAMRAEKAKVAGSKVSHAKLQKTVAALVGCHLRTVKKYCPKRA